MAKMDRHAPLTSIHGEPVWRTSWNRTVGIKPIKAKAGKSFYRDGGSGAVEAANQLRGRYGPTHPQVAAARPKVNFQRPRPALPPLTINMDLAVLDIFACTKYLSLGATA
jgi:hypothetical protein